MTSVQKAHTLYDESPLSVQPFLPSESRVLVQGSFPLLATTLGEPIGLALAIILLGMAVAVVLRYRRRGLVAGLCFLAAGVISFLTADLRLDNADGASPNIVVVDLSQSFRPALDRNWGQWRVEIDRLLREDNRPAHVLFLDGEPHPSLILSPEEGLPGRLPASRGVGTNLRNLQTQMPIRYHRLLFLSDGALRRSDLSALAPVERMQAFTTKDRVHDGVRILRTEFSGQPRVGDEAALIYHLSGDADGECLVTIEAQDADAEDLAPILQTVKVSKGLEVAASVVVPAEWWGSGAELRVRISVESPGLDDLPQNNSVTCILRGRDSRVAVLVGAGTDSDLSLFLEAQSFLIQHYDLPRQVSQRELAGADLVVLYDVPDSAFGPDRGRGFLERATSLGATILVAGLANAFAPGGYAGGPLETVLPVNVTPEEAPPMAHLLLLDASASMAESVQGSTRFSVLGQAARAYLDHLPQNHSAASILFNTSMKGSRGFMEPKKAQTELMAMLAETAPQGPTLLRAALLAGLEECAKLGQEVQAKRLIVLSDGLSSEDVPTTDELVLRLRQIGAELHMLVLNDQVPAWIETLRNQAPEQVRLYQGLSYDKLLTTLLKLQAESGGDWIRRTPTDFVELDTSGEAKPGPPLRLESWVATSVKAGGNARALFRANDESGAPLLATWDYGSSRVMALMAPLDGFGSALRVSETLQVAIATQATSSLASGIRVSVEGKILRVGFEGISVLPLGSGLRARLIDADGRTLEELDGLRIGIDGRTEFHVQHEEALQVADFVRIEGVGELAGIKGNFPLNRSVLEEFLPGFGSQEQFLGELEAAGGAVVQFEDQSLPKLSDPEDRESDLVWVLLVSLSCVLLACIWVARS